MSEQMSEERQRGKSKRELCLCGRISVFMWRTRVAVVQVEPCGSGGPGPGWAPFLGGGTASHSGRYPASAVKCVGVLFLPQILGARGANIRPIVFGWQPLPLGSEDLTLERVCCSTTP